MVGVEEAALGVQVVGEPIYLQQLMSGVDHLPVVMVQGVAMLVESTRQPICCLVLQRTQLMRQQMDAVGSQCVE